MKYSATNHFTDWREVILICLVTSVFIFITLDGVTSFSASQSKFLAGFLFVLWRKLETSEGHICLSVISCVLESKQSLANK